MMQGAGVRKGRRQKCRWYLFMNVMASICSVTSKTLHDFTGVLITHAHADIPIRWATNWMAGVRFPSGARFYSSP
jgi:hypothetical protein